MAQLINEAKRMQLLAGIITESQINELNEPEKELVDAILGEGINEGKFNPKEILAKLIAVAKKGLLTATVLSTVLASCNFGPSVDETIKNRVEQYKVIDSMELAQKERDEAFKNKMDSLKQDLKAIEYPVTQSQQESLSEIRQLVRETINEMSMGDETIFSSPDDEEYDMRGDAERTGQSFFGEDEARALWNALNVANSTSIGSYVAAIKQKGVPEDQALKLAFAYDDKFSKEYNSRRKMQSFKKSNRYR
jgi:enoyl reductase-like protein